MSLTVDCGKVVSEMVLVVVVMVVVSGQNPSALAPFILQQLQTSALTYEGLA